MSIFGKIMSSIFGHASAQTPQAAPPPGGKTSTSAGAGSAPAASGPASARGGGESSRSPFLDGNIFSPRRSVACGVRFDFRVT